MQQIVQKLQAILKVAKYRPIVEYLNPVANGLKLQHLKVMSTTGIP